VFDSNEGLSVSVIESSLIRATERILTQLRSTSWWVNYYVNRHPSVYRTVADVPALDITRIISRTNDFTDLCVYTALSDIILPRIADFGDNDNAERKKMQYYQQKAEMLFGELIQAGDWYDFNDDGLIESVEKQPGYWNLRRVR